MMIEAETLAKRYDETRALADVDLVVLAGSILGLLGPNGAGSARRPRNHPRSAVDGAAAPRPGRWMVEHVRSCVGGSGGRCWRCPS